MIHYVYLTTNLIDGKQYIGDRTCYCELEKDKYLGSGIYYKAAEKCHGKTRFKKVILEIFETRKEAFDAQEKYIKQYNTLTPNGYNISPKGGHECSNAWSQESKEKLSKSRQGIKPWNYKLTNCYSKETLTNMSKVAKGRTFSEKTLLKISANSKKLKHSEETKEKLRKPRTAEIKNKISQTLKGRTWEDIYGIEGANKRRKKSISQVSF
jgi:hypothetical protein